MWHKKKYIVILVFLVIKNMGLDPDQLMKGVIINLKKQNIKKSNLGIEYFVGLCLLPKWNQGKNNWHSKYC
jgi:hypothetical protein